MLTTRRKLEAALLTLVSVSVAVNHVSCLVPRDTVVGVIALMVKRLTVVSPAYSSFHLLPMRSLKVTQWSDTRWLPSPYGLALSCSRALRRGSAHGTRPTVS